METLVVDILTHMKWLRPNHKHASWLTCNYHVYGYGGKWNLQFLNLMINKGIYILDLTFPALSRVYIITLWNYEAVVYIQSFITDITLFLRQFVGKQFER